MQALINVTIPIFGIMLAGWLAGRFRILGQDSTAALNGFVYWFALPALFLKATVEAPVAQVFDPDYLGVVVGGYAVTLIVSLIAARMFFSRNLGEVGLHGTAAVFSNTGYMGIPLVLTAFGDSATVPLISAVLANIAVVLGFGIAVLEIDRSKGSGLRAFADAALGLIKNPLILAAALGLSLSALSLPLPGPANTFLDLLSAAAGPCALFAMGLFLVGQSIRRGAGEVVWASGIKLVLHPLITWLIAIYFFELTRMEEAVAVLLAALPTGGLIFVLAQRYGVYIQRAAAIILVSTVISIATVSFIVQHYTSI